ncbi:2-oxo acid dehydrogenase subunit E2 [Brevibacillus laterosporus]|uniref:2-oxo acid dehydrogenase subunit E2 n=1 Tax=Brevibacillus laterosporus TaxID=1465 RepID=UPI002654D893|nr:2-oxo acid dehydrogenase subunit E2 [Brevibacillus laterosporus]MDN9008886.1 2-oxo acid dehydrogenase subunit E2 [Brevibacillus laterosporus]MDO0940993.1 2-oxo acid dehydrogenase subunit E2 [Brevibacillus laterosporus]
MATGIFMPKLSMTMETGTILQWFKKEGDLVEEGDLLLEVMTDKINIEVEAYATGTLLKIYDDVNAIVPVQKIIGYIGEQGEQVPDTPPEIEREETPADASKASEENEAKKEASTSGEETNKVRATPAARRLSREYGVALYEMKGRGTNGRIHAEDVEAYVKSVQERMVTPLAKKIASNTGVQLNSIQGSGANGKITKQDVLQAPPNCLQAAMNSSVANNTKAVELSRVKLGGMRKVISERMTRSVTTAPHVTLVTEADMSNAIKLRKSLLSVIESQTGYRLSYTEIVIKAAAIALRQHPQMNASVEGDYIIYKQEVNTGLAVSVPNGLMVPVVKHADQKGLATLTAECKELGRLARAGKLLPDQTQGGSFTISNLGMYDIDAFTPIINQPEIAILGVGRITEKAVGIHGELKLRPQMTLSLSFDHRIVDGAPAAEFLQSIKRSLEEPYQLLV